MVKYSVLKNIVVKVNCGWGWNVQDIESVAFCIFSLLHSTIVAFALTIEVLM
jgi:hypothetical protein